MHSFIPSTSSHLMPTPCKALRIYPGKAKACAWVALTFQRCEVVWGEDGAINNEHHRSGDGMSLYVMDRGARIQGVWGMAVYVAQVGTPRREALSYHAGHSNVTLTGLSLLIWPLLADSPKCQLWTEIPHCSPCNLEVKSCRWHWWARCQTLSTYAAHLLFGIRHQVLDTNT